MRYLSTLLVTSLSLQLIQPALATSDWSGWRVAPSVAVPPVEIGNVAQPMALESSIPPSAAAMLEKNNEVLPVPTTIQPLGSLSVYMPELDTSITPPDHELIAETARGLDFNWVRCYLFVRDHIRFTPYPGILRGPDRTLLDRTGNAADQALLLLALLRASGYNANLMYVAPPSDSWNGGFGIPLGGDAHGYDAVTWLGCSSGTVNNTWGTVGTLLSSAGITAHCSGSGSSLSGYTVRLEHYWVRLTLDSINYHLDPAFKPSFTTLPRNVLADAGYNRGTLLAAAGGTLGTSSIQGISSASLNSALDALTLQLATTWQELDPIAAASNFIGGNSIVPQNINLDPYLFHGALHENPVEFAAQSPLWQNARRTALSITHGAINKTIWLDEIATRLLWLSYSDAPGHNYPKATLWLDSEAIVLETSGAAQEGVTLTLAVDHPYADMVATYDLTRAITNVFSIVVGMGGDHPGGMRTHTASALARARATGTPELALRALSLHSVGQQWLAQTALANTLSGRISGVHNGLFYSLGVAGQAKSPYVDLKNAYSYTTGNSSRFDGYMLFASALEHAVLDQVNAPNAPAVSTVRILDLANSANTPIHFATQNNYATTVRPLLENYPTSQLDAFGIAVNTGRTLLLPQDGATTLNQWHGTGWIEHGPSSAGGYTTGMIISGGMAGGYTSVQNRLDNAVVDTAYQNERLDNAATPKTSSADPVEQPSGAYISDRTDLTLAGPMPLVWSRHYDSRRRHDNGALGRGWNHGYDAAIVRHADPDASFGNAAPAAAAPTALAVAVVADLLADQGNLGAGAEAQQRTLAALVAQWWTEQLTGGAVSVRLGARTLAFQRQPDNSYVAAPGVTATLSEQDGLFTLQERLGNTYTFDSHGRLATITDPSANTTTLHYDTAGQLATISNNFGRTLSLTWHNNQIVAVSDSAGRNINYAYDTAGCLTNFTDAAGHSWRASYDSDGALISQRDPEDNFTIQNSYNALGQVIHQISSANAPWFFGYAANTRSWDIDPHYQREIRNHDSAGRVIMRQHRDGSLNDYIYDDSGRLIEHYDPIARLNRYEYDADHRLVRLTEAVNTPNARATTFVYDSRHRLTSRTNALNLVTHFDYDDHDRLVVATLPDNITASNSWSVAGLRLSETLRSATGQSLRHTTFTYDTRGRPASKTVGGPDISLATNTTEFDEAGRLIRLQDANGQTTLFNYDARGLLTNTTDAAGHSIATIYNGRGMPVATTDPLGRTTTFFWTPSGDPAVRILPDGTSTTNHYDALDRLSATTDARGTRVEIERDILGRITSRHTPRWQEQTWYDIVGVVTSVVDAADTRTDLAYDWLDRPVLTTDSLGQKWWSFFDALDRLDTTTDPRGRSRHYSYDPLNRRTSATKPSGATDKFGYDALGNWTSYTNAEGRVYTMTYDALNRPLTATNAANEQVFFNSYDLAGNLTNRIDGANNSITYRYDVLNRLTERAAQSVQSVQSVDQFSYDPVGNLLTASNETATLSFTYDVMDRLATASTMLTTGHSPLATYQSAYAYDAGGLVTNLIYAAGKVVTRTYDADGRLATVSDWLGHTWTFTWDGAGKPVACVAPSGVVATNSYDAAGRLASWRVGNLAGRTITRDAAGLKIREEIIAGPLPVPQKVRYAENTFDAADRLVTASVRYDSHSNAATTESYLYDGNSALTNLTSGTATVFAASYNPLGQLSSLQTSHWPLATSHFQYDALGNRLVASGVVWLPDHADPLKRPLIEADATTGEPIRYYLWGAGRLLGFIDAQTEALTVAHCDDYGSVIALTDASGNVIHTANYGLNGQDWGSTGHNPTPFAWLGGHGVHTINSDTPLCLYLTRYRLYAASLNRFLSADPLGLAGGLNLYTYALGDPLSYIDPLGLCAEGIGGDFLTRLAGAGQMLGGAAEAVAGYTFGTATSPTVAGGLLGAAVGTHGIDNVQAGARQFWTGKQVDTMTSDLLQSAGLSRNAANMVNAGISIAATLGASAANATTAPSVSISDDFVTVSRWGREGLQPGDFVMKGSANTPNYVLSGKYQPQSWPGNNVPAPFASGQEFAVPATTLHIPKGILGPVKGVLGQRIYNP